jgi:hypothetical protein
MTVYAPVDLDPYCNAVGATSDDYRNRGQVNAWGNSFPAEEIPFGSVLQVGAVPFRLPTKRANCDHLEAMGQSISLPARPPVSGLALLCFGEMGDQELDVELDGPDGECNRLTVLAPTWLVDRGQDPVDDCYCCSHLHYAGGYELALLRPTMWCWHRQWERQAPLTRLRMGRNPLFHLLAVTLLHRESPDA